MKKYYCSIVFLFSIFYLNAQSLESIKTVDQANEFIEKHPEIEAEILSFTTTRDTINDYENFIVNQNADSEYNFKILDKKPVFSFRVSYIYFDGSKLSVKEINNRRQDVLNKLKLKVPFAKLSDQYTMDNNQNGGDLGWFEEGTMVSEFEKAIKSHKKGDVFTVDMPDRKWYYVVLKTHDEEEKIAVNILTIKR
nr:peptidylprolyl isomerase [uncultured Flavobacterium sp.]